MRNWGYEVNSTCHWCGKDCKTRRPERKHCFCNNACKMAHYRAYKNYVTHTARSGAHSQAKSVTQKKRKKKHGNH